MESTQNQLKEEINKSFSKFKSKRRIQSTNEVAISVALSGPFVDFFDYLYYWWAL